ALARREGRHEDEVAAVQVLDRTNLRERRMFERVERPDPLAQRVLEAVRTAELGAKTQQLERRRAGVIEHEQSITNGVAEAFGVPAGQRCRCGRVGPISY